MHASYMRTLAVFGYLLVTASVSKGMSTGAEEASPNTASPDTGEMCNINVCFALDGSSSITPRSYEQQRSTAIRAARNIFDRSGARALGLAAVQYGAAIRPISPFTTDRRAFLSALRSSVQSRGNGTFLTGGVNYCFSELFEKNNNRNTIVVLGDGQANIGSDASDRANLFSTNGGQVLSVGVGGSLNATELVAIAGGDRSKLFFVGGTNNSVTEVAARLAMAICQ